MKRPEYTVTWDNGTFIKYSWNSARNAIVTNVRKILFVGEEFTCSSFEGKCDERGNHVRGREVWTSNQGRKVEFTIVRTKERS